MDKVKQLMQAGATAGEAIRVALPMTLSALALKHGLPRSSTSEAFNGLRRATDAQVAALVAELGGTSEEWREVLQQARLEHAAAVA